MTLTELYALSAFIDQLASDDDYEHNAESARLDAIFVKECHDAGRNPIEVSRAAEAYWERRQAERAVDFAFGSGFGGNISHVGLIAKWNRRQA